MRKLLNTVYITNEQAYLACDFIISETTGKSAWSISAQRRLMIRKV